MIVAGWFLVCCHPAPNATWGPSGGGKSLWESTREIGAVPVFAFFPLVAWSRDSATTGTSSQAAGQMDAQARLAREHRGRVA